MEIQPLSALPKDVAIVIPVRNHPDHLEKCLSSLSNQDFPLKDCEVLICDDHSDEDMNPVISRFRGRLPRIRLLRQRKPKGPAAARNFGFRSSSADIFICLDSDIVCASNFIRFLVRALAMNPEWVAAEATVLPLNGKCSILCDAPRNRGGSFPSGASAYHSDALKRVGGFDEEYLLPACEDVDLAARLIQLGKYGYVPEAVAYHPVRQVTLRTHWRWRRHWKYEMILAKRYGFLSFPGHSAGKFPRLRVAWAAVVNLPGGRLLEGIQDLKRKPGEGLVASLYALFDVCCGIWALPDILFTPVPPSRNYFQKDQPTHLSESEPF